MATEPLLRLAFLGCGFATHLHSRTLRRFGSRVQRLYASRDLKKAEDYNRRYGGVGAFGSYEAALEDSSVGVVLIATPPDSHLELATRALAAGKHVIVEKPPFRSSADVDLARELANAAGKRLLVAENYFYKPMAEALREVIASGEIGDLRILSVNALKRQRTGGWRDQGEMAGGGALFEGGIHWINFMANLGPEVLRAHGFRPGRGEGPERSMVVVLEYVGGAVGTLYHSWETDAALKGLHLSAIYGSEGTVTFESNGLFLAIRGRKRRVRVPDPRDLLGYGAMFEDFIASITTGAEPRFDLAAARRDLELLEQVYASAARGEGLRG